MRLPLPILRYSVITHWTHFLAAVGMLRKKFNHYSKAITISKQTAHSEFWQNYFFRANIKILTRQVNVHSLGRVSELRECYPVLLEMHLERLCQHSIILLHSSKGFKEMDKVKPLKNNYKNIQILYFCQFFTYKFIKYLNIHITYTLYIHTYNIHGRVFLVPCEKSGALYAYTGQITYFMVPEQHD